MLCSHIAETLDSQGQAAADFEEMQLAFRNVMASVPAPVTVVTAIAAGNAHGTTVSAFASLSLDPPMVMVALDRNSELLNILRKTGEFGVNILQADQATWAGAFAKKGSDKFEGIPWSVDHGLPRLLGTGWIACSVAALVDGGDHVIALGAVVGVDLAATGEPLTYCQRTFGPPLPVGP